MSVKRVQVIKVDSKKDLAKDTLLLYFGNDPITHRITHNGAVGWPELAQKSTKANHSAERLLRHTTDVPRSVI
jgi:hypothetical protein